MVGKSFFDKFYPCCKYSFEFNETYLFSKFSYTWTAMTIIVNSCIQSEIGQARISQGFNIHSKYAFPIFVQNFVVSKIYATCVFAHKHIFK